MKKQKLHNIQQEIVTTSTMRLTFGSTVGCMMVNVAQNIIHARDFEVDVLCVPRGTTTQTYLTLPLKMHQKGSWAL